MKRTGATVLLTVAVTWVLTASGVSAQNLLLYEPFDYPNGEALNAQANWTGGAPVEGLQILNGDGAGDSGTSSLEIPGLSSQGGRLKSTQRFGGDADILLPGPITGEGSVLYVSFLYKPIEVGNSYFAHNNTDGSIQGQLGRWDSKNPNAPNTTFVARWRDGSTRVFEPGMGHPSGTTVFVVARTTLVPDIDNDTFDLWIDPMPGGPEPAATASATSLIGGGNDIDPAVGILGFSLRVSNSTGVFEIDELRMGTTWESVTTAQAQVSCSASRAITPQFFLPGETVSVTVSAKDITGTTAVTETIPDGWTVADAGGGAVAGNTLTFDLSADGQVSYQLTAPGAVCQDVEISGTIAGANGCAADVLGVSRLRCAETGGILISGDVWDGFLDIDAAGALPQIVVTTDGLKSLHFPGPDSNAGFILYALNVTQLPAGRSRFPVQLYARNIGGQNTTGFGIRNLTIDPETDPGLQDSFVSIALSGGGATQARDERWIVGTEGEDPEGTIAKVGRTQDPTDSTAPTAAAVVQTVNATLELRTGENLLRIDATDPADLPEFQPDQGWQVFRLVIGPDEMDLQGSIVVTCAARRAISPEFYLPGETVMVTLSARNVAGPTTVTETFPNGWTVANDGGGTVAGNTIAFDITQDATLTYELTVPDGFCEAVTFSGMIAGAAGCGREVSGDSEIGCIPLPPGAVIFNFDTTGPTTDAELPNFFDLLGFNTVFGPSGWRIEPNAQNAANGSNALHTTSDGGQLENWFSRVAILKTSVFEAQDVEFAARITFDDLSGDANDHAGVYVRFKGNSDVPLENEFYFVRINAGGTSDITLHRVRDGLHEGLMSVANDPFVISEGDTVQLNVRAEGNDIFVSVNGQPVVGLDPFTDFDPLLGCGRVGAGENSNPTYFDNLAFADLDTQPCPCSASRALSSRRFAPGDTVTVTLSARNLTGATTLADTFPNGWSVANAGSGAVNGNTIMFGLDADGAVSYQLNIPGDFCQDAEFAGTIMGAGNCANDVVGQSRMSCVFGCSDLQPSGAVPDMLIIGPVDLGGNTGPNCDDNGKLGNTDYLKGQDLTNGTAVDEASLQAVFGDEIRPDFGGAAGGTGVAAVPNPDINLRASEDILTVWLADVDPDGRIRFNDDDNLGDSLDDFLIYSLVYLDNTTGGPLAVTLRVGSDDSAKVIFNGVQAHLDSACGSVGGVDAGDKVPVTLQPGINTVLIAVVDRQGNTDVRLLVYDDLDLAPLDDGSVRACLAPDLGPPPELFVRGDSDSNGTIELTDGIVTLTFLFVDSNTSPACFDAADTDDDGALSITDGIRVFQWLFVDPTQIPLPPSPRPGLALYEAQDCGTDPKADDLGCETLANTCQ